MLRTKSLSCCCLTKDDLTSSLVDISPSALDSLAPSPWRTHPTPENCDHVHSAALGDYISDAHARKESKADCRPIVKVAVVHRRKKEEKHPSAAGPAQTGFSHLEPEEYIRAYRASRTSGVATVGTDSESKLYTLDPDKLRTAAVEVDSNTMKQKLQNIKSLVSARETPVHFSPRIQPTIPPPVALPHSHSTMLHKTTVYTSSPLTTVTVEKRKQGNRSRPVVIINLLQNAMLSDGPPPPLPRPFVTHTPKPPPLIKNHNTSNQSSTCTCSCGRDSNVNGIDENYVLTSDVVALLKTKSEILRSANGRLLSARWRHSLNSKQTLPPVNDSTVHNEVKIKQLQTQPKSDSSSTSDSERVEAATDQWPIKEPPLPCSLSVPKLSPISVVKGSALLSPQRLSDKFRSSLPNMPMEKCQQKQIDIDQFEAAEKFTRPVRNCLSAKVGREGTGSQHTKARVDARRHKRCMQKSSHKRVTATNWQNFTAEEVDMSSALTWRPTFTLK